MFTKIKQSVFAAGLSSLLLASPALADNGRILEGVVDIPRLSATGPVDGCAKIQKGLINNGGFLLFTCEKLLPYFPITDHASTFAQYKNVLTQNGWRAKASSGDKAQFERTDATGCKAHLDMTLWKDRSMNEPKRASSDRDAHRQIVFMARFYGSACEHYYPTATALADARP